MNIVIDRFNKIKSIINESNQNKNINIIAVSKTVVMENILPLIKYGHQHFGENKVQEAEKKWFTQKKIYPDVKLHMLGKLQSNKAEQAAILFDYIHSLDSVKLANKLNNAEEKIKKKLKYFIQVNIGSESQKSGIRKEELSTFIEFLNNKTDLNIIGLMCIPPVNQSPDVFFDEMLKLNKLYGFKELSMGMSGDYIEAIKYEATYIRLGTSIFGARNT